MNSSVPNDSEYPYGSNNRAGHESKTVSRRGSFLSRWVVPFVWAAGVLAILALATMSVVLVRGFSQSRTIAEIEGNGGYVTYRFEPGWLRKLLPLSFEDHARWLGQVNEVTLLGAWGDLPEEEVRRACDACSRLHGLRAFTVATPSFSCEQISNWPSLKSLERLDINSPRIAASDFSVISRMPELKRLRLESATVTCEALQVLATLPNLESLTLEKVKFNGSCPGTAASFRALKTLVVSESSEIGDDAIAGFGPLPQIEHLVINRAPISDVGLAYVLEMSSGHRLRELIIRDAKISDAGMAVLAKYSAPRSLVLTDMPLTDAALKPLAGKEFSTLVFDHTEMTDEAFRALNDIVGIEYVSFEHTKVTGIGAAYLKKDRLLGHFAAGEPALTNEGLKVLAKSPFKKLTITSSRFDDAELRLFLPNDDLTELILPENQLTGDMLKAFFQSRRDRLQKEGKRDPLKIVLDSYGNTIETAATALDGNFDELRQQP